MSPKPFASGERQFGQGRCFSQARIVPACPDADSGLLIDADGYHTAPVPVVVQFSHRDGATPLTHAQIDAVLGALAHFGQCENLFQVGAADLLSAPATTLRTKTTRRSKQENARKWRMRPASWKESLETSLK
jgi:hypothetical protein